MHRLLTVGLIAATLFPATAKADGHDLVRDFAACAGRYSAKMEHLWLMGHAAEEAQRRRMAFVELLDALVPDAYANGLSPRRVLAWRIDAKFAYAAMLQQDTFSSAAPQVARTNMVLTFCDELLLSG